MSALSNDSINLNKLKFPKDYLYDRESEQQILRDVYRRLVAKSSDVGDDSDDQSTKNRNKEVVMVEGNSGVGKSALVGTLRSLVEKRRKKNGYFLSGKFDLQHRAVPYAAIIEALSGLPELMSGEDTKRVQIRLGDEVSKIIARCVPALKDVIFDTASSPDNGSQQQRQERRQSRVAIGSEFRNKFNYAFQTFFQSICDESNKILVLFMDDMQWADAASLDLLEILINDDNICNLLVIGAYRSNEVDEVHPLSARIREIERSGHRMIRLVVRNLSLDAMKNMVSDTLNMSVEEISPLAEVVQSKTHGNVYFAMQLLDSLAADELLTFSFGTFKWSWNIVKISSVCVTSNVADLMLKKLRKVTQEEQTILALSSCLGSSFDLPILIMVIIFLLETIENSTVPQYVKEALSFINISADDVESCMDKTLSKGLLEVAASIEEKSIRFSHDQLQQAAHSLIPEESQGILQWHVGKALVNKLTDDELSVVLFSAVDLLNSGHDFVLSQLDSGGKKDLVDLAKLNLEAGYKAMEISAFLQSVKYLEFSLRYIQDACGGVKEAWEKHPDFSLDAYQSLADSLNCVGEMDKASEIVDMILIQSSSMEGRMNAYATLVDAYGAQDQVQKAFDSGFRAAAELGEKFPRNAGKGTILLELLQMKFFMRKYPAESIQSLPRLDDMPRAILMKIFVRLLVHAQVDCPKYVPLMTFRLVKWSCIFGIDPSTSSAGFAFWGMVLAGLLGDLQAGYRYASVATDLLEKYNVTSGYSFTSAVASVVKINQDPVVNTIKGDLVGYQIGMQQGETFFAFMNIVKMLVNSYSSGRALFVVEADMKIFAPHSADKGQSYIFNRIQPLWQLLRLLMGNDKYNTADCKLSGEVMDEDDFLSKHDEEPGLVALVSVYKLLLSYLCGDLESAGSMSNKTQGYAQKYGAGTFLAVRFTFFDALTSLTLSKLGKKKWKRRATNQLKTMSSWQKKGNVNVTSMLLLLEAEKYTLNKKIDMSLARSKFDQAISSAAKAGFANDRALANERAGVFFSTNGESYWAAVYLARAHQCWTEYGALAICELLERRYPQYITRDVMQSSTLALDGAKKRLKRASTVRRSNNNSTALIFKDASESWASIRTTSMANSATTRLSASFVSTKST